VVEKILRVPWTARGSNQSILKEISPEYSFEELMLKLKLQYFGYLMWRAASFEKTLMLGEIESGGEGDDRGWDDLCMRTCRNTGTPIVLCFTDNALKKNKLDIYGNAVSGKDIDTTFPTAYAHFMFLCHILIILAVFQTILSLLYLLFWSVMSDFYYYPINVQMISILLAVKYWK